MSTSTTNQRLLRGIGAGLAGGLASATVMLTAVEPAIRKSLALEASNNEHAHSHGEALAANHDHGELVSRTTQLVGGLATALIVGVLLGLAFAIVFDFVRDRLPGLTATARSVVLGALVFAVMGLLPAWKTPANPPGIGDPATVNDRTFAYVSTILLGLILVILCFAAVNATRRRYAPEVRWLVGSGLAAVGLVVILILPSASAGIPASMPAALVWEFRTASLAQLAAQFMTIALVLGVLTDRSVGRDHTPARARDDVPLPY